MSHGDIYNSLHAAVYKVVEPYHIIISDTERGNRMRLEWYALRADRYYTITTSDEYSHGASTALLSVTKAAYNIEVILQHWGLVDAAYIFPPEIAPRAPFANDQRPTIYDILDEDTDAFQDYVENRIVVCAQIV